MGIATQGPSLAATKQDSPGSAAQEQQMGTEMNFSQSLEQQISQAIQPVLNEFRQQMAQTIAQQKEAQPAPASGGQAAPQAPAPQAPAPQQPTPQQAQPTQPEGHPGVREGVSQVKQSAQNLVAEAVRPAIQVAERQGEQWIESLLIAGLAALLAESTRNAIEQRAEQGLHTLLEKAFEPLPKNATSQEVQAQVEQTLKAILQAALVAVFTEALLPRTQEGEQAIRKALHGDFAAAGSALQDIVKAIFDAIVTVLRQQWKSLVRLLLVMLLLVLEGSLEKSLAKGAEHA
ncbi:MAG: hypothetical protein ACXVCO_06310 [Ktedonobacterales bacterium]